MLRKSRSGQYVTGLRYVDSIEKEVYQTSDGRESFRLVRGSCIDFEDLDRGPSVPEHKSDPPIKKEGSSPSPTTHFFF